MPSWITRTIGITALMLLLLAMAALLAPLLIDKEQLLSDLEQELGRSLGRPVRIEAIGLLRFLPRPALRVDGVQIAASTLADAPTLATADALRLDAALGPLLTGRLVLAEVLIDRPRVALVPTPSLGPSVASPASLEPGGYQSILAAYEPGSQYSPDPALREAGSFTETAAAAPAQLTPAQRTPAQRSPAQRSRGQPTRAREPLSAEPRPGATARAWSRRR